MLASICGGMELIEQGTGKPFAPAGKVFKEWTSISAFDEDRWLAIIREACAFVSA